MKSKQLILVFKGTAKEFKEYIQKLKQKAEGK